MSTGMVISSIVVAGLIIGLLASLVPGLRAAARHRAEAGEFTRLEAESERQEDA